MRRYIVKLRLTRTLGQSLKADHDQNKQWHELILPTVVLYEGRKLQ